MSVQSLALQALALTDLASDALVATTTGHAAPAHVFRSHGPPSLELDFCCEGAVAVWLDDLNHDPINQTGPEPGCDPAENYAVWAIAVYRCAAENSGTQAGPSADDLDDHAADLLVDAWALLTEAYDRNREGTLLPGCDCSAITFGRLTRVDPEGGCAGWEFRITVDLSCLSDTGS